MSYLIVTDTACDLPSRMLQDLKVDVIPLTAHFPDGRVLEDGFKEMSSPEFFNYMRQGNVVTTSQVNMTLFYDKFKAVLEEYDALLYLGFSSGLSGTYQSSLLAKQTLEDEDQRYVGRIFTVDSLAASLGFGLTVLEACRVRDTGASVEALFAYLEEARFHVNHWFTVDDLVYLKRGGRISSMKAAMGTLLNIKPILYVNNEGKLIPISKAKGRKKSIHFLFDMFKQLYEPSMGKNFLICHGDCLEDAQLLKKLIMDAYDMNEPVIAPVGMVIGSHSGPGTLSLFFLGKPRESFQL
ncbi:DegV family protein [Clostridiaceae bacterium JG1575]|nr:DegV family protein [Clostridiaceae bacterium JG1575]